MRRLSLLMLLACSVPVQAAELPVTEVVLSAGGLMQLQRSGRLAADESASFRVPLAAVDDVLKSLVVRDPAGTVAGVRLPAQDLAEVAFQGLPLRAEDFASHAALLNALRGQMVEAGGRSGRIAEASETEQGLRLALITPQGLASVLLRDGEETRLQDAGLAARLAQAAAALATARSADTRLVEVLLRGRATRQVELLSLLPAPVWKPSWRLLVPGTGENAPARLQGWAVVENRSGADWNAVRLSLVSGEAASLHQPLYAPVEAPRRELPLRLPEILVAQADSGPRPAPPPPAIAPAPAAREALRAPSAPALQQAAASPALAAISPGRIAFTLAEPVSLSAGMTANLPFLEASLPAERLWWIQDLRARHPLQALRLTNDGAQTLPDGVVTVFGSSGAEAGAWLGDAELRALSPGESRLLAFGRDRDVLVTTATHHDSRAVEAQLQPGRVLLRTREVEEVAFAIDPRGAKGDLVIDLSRRPGATPRFTVAAEGDFGLRHRASLDGSPTTLRLGFERPSQRAINLWDAGLGDPLLLDWRALDIQPSLPRLPGGTADLLDTLRKALEQLPAEAPGRAALARLTEQLAEARRRLDAFMASWRDYRAADAALDRARAAAEDRTGAAKEAARNALNRASQAAETAGSQADVTWKHWQDAVQQVLAAAP